MNRCRKCNTELTKQARFCNLCGSPQTPAESQVEVSTPTKQVAPAKTITNHCHKCETEIPANARFCNLCGSPQIPAESQVEVSAPTKQEAPAKTETNLCHKCEAELPVDARFCNLCGSTQGSKARSLKAPLSSEPVTAEPKPKNDKTLSDSPKPSTQLLTPTRSIQPASKHVSSFQQSGGNPIRPKTNVHPPVFPSRPTSTELKSPVASPQRDSSQPVLSPQPAASASPLNTSSPSASATPKFTQQPDTSRPTNQPTPSILAKDENISNTPTQSLGNASIPARTPGLIRPIVPPSPARSVIPSRPDTTEMKNAAQQTIQTSLTPGYIAPATPARISTPARPQSQQRSSSSYTLPGTRSQNNEQIANLATHQLQHQVSPPNQVSGDVAPGQRQEQTARNQMTPVGPSRQISSTYDIDELSTRNLSDVHMNGQNGLADTPTANLFSPESFVATSKAAEHWHKSWRDRQYAEAGPAENVSRGQASVPMPLTTMHQSFARMRAIARTNQQQQARRSINLGSWITIFLMICLIAGLGAYIIVSYLPNSPFGAVHVVPLANATQPTLTLQGQASQTIQMGQTIHLHGEHFSANNTITFLLDTIIPIVDTGGKNISTHANNQGAFDVAFLISSNWTTGSHLIEAIDNGSKRTAFLTIDVIPRGTPAISSKDLSVEMDGKRVQQLTFKAVISQGNPVAQEITITNTSRMPLKWSATAIADNNLSWLNINDNQTYGKLAISQPHKMLISVDITGLKSATNTPYTGRLVFTINDNQQLTLPVQLQISDTTSEMVFSPNPIIAHIGAGNTCQPGVTLTLINLGAAVISWTVNPDDQANIQFVNPATGKLMESGQLAPSGLTGDTQVLTLRCNSVQVGHQYHISVYANQMSWSELVIIKQ